MKKIIDVEKLTDKKYLNLLNLFMKQKKAKKDMRLQVEKPFLTLCQKQTSRTRLE